MNTPDRAAAVAGRSQRLRQLILEQCEGGQWITKARLYHAADTLLAPEFFRRWAELNPNRRVETPTRFRASMVSKLRYMFHRLCVQMFVDAFSGHWPNPKGK